MTIFEAQALAGGLLRSGIPEYRLPRAIIDYEIGLFAAMGIEIRTGVRIGRDRTLEQLLGDGFSAAVLATGAPKDRAPGIPGEELPGAQGALASSPRSTAADARVGRRVAVVGGGNSAIDAARVAVRLGAAEVTIVYRRGEEQMPAQREEIAAARAEGVALRLLTSPVAVLESGGRARGLRCVTMALGEPDASGRRRPEPLPGSEHDLRPTPSSSRSATGRRGLLGDIAGVVHDGGRIAVDVGRRGTRDLRGRRCGARARQRHLGDGRGAARGAGRDGSVSGEQVEMPTGRAPTTTARRALRGGITQFARREVAAPRHRATRTGFAEVEARDRKEDAVAEASRCLQCGICCECGACVAACAEAGAIDHAGGAGTSRCRCSPPCAPCRRTGPAGAGHLLFHGAAPEPAALLERLRDDARAALQARRRSIAAAPGVHVFLCSCNDSVHHRELIAPLAAEVHALPAWQARRSSMPPASRAAEQPSPPGCSPENTGASSSRPASAAGSRSSAAAARTSAPGQGFLSPGGIPLQLVETLDLRDEVLNQRGLDRDAALRLARRSLAAGVARAHAAENRTAVWLPCQRHGGASRVDRAQAGQPIALPRCRCRAARSRPRRHAALCRGCGTCRNCPQEAIDLQPRPSVSARADRRGGVHPLRALPRGCPTGAPDAPFAGHPRSVHP